MGNVMLILAVDALFLRDGKAVEIKLLENCP
jgi:hypothetical protein